MTMNGTPEDRKRWASTYYQRTKQEHADWQREYCKTLKGKLAKLRGKANSKGIEVTITIEDLEQILSSGKCHYCEHDLPESGYNVDRLDNRVGYIAVNCVPCCFSCNSRKGGLELAGLTYPRTVEILLEILGK
jgi:hypothetical protein